MKIIFEDNGQIPSSKLLSYNNPNAVIFAESNSRINKRIKEVLRQNRNEHIIVYIDLVPDNPRLLQTYNQIMEFTSLSCNIVVIPIICIEYYIAKLMQYLSLDTDVPDIDVAIKSVDEKKDWRTAMSPAFAACFSLEKVFKKFFCEDSKFFDKYYWNITKNTKSFYTQDDTITVKEKSEILWYLLPVFQEGAVTEITSKKYNWMLKSLSWNDIRNKARNIVTEFIKLYRAYGCTEFPICN